MASYACRRGQASRGTPRFERAIATEARRRKVRVLILPGYEPLVIDLDAVSARDVRVLRERYHTGRGDLTEPLVGAMGRALGYGCALPVDHKRPEHVFRLEARLYDTGTGQPQPSLYLAAFRCRDGGSRDGGELLREWVARVVAPACAALAGCSLQYGDRRLMIAGLAATLTPTPRR